jgi:hypothetical protein
MQRNSNMQIQMEFVSYFISSPKNCLWWPRLLMDRDEMSNLYRGHSIHASYQVSVHLAVGFQRRFKCEKLTDDGRQVMAKAHLCDTRVYENILPE